MWEDGWELSQGWESHPCPRAQGVFAAAVAELQEEPGAEMWLHPNLGAAAAWLLW